MGQILSIFVLLVVTTLPTVGQKSSTQGQKKAVSKAPQPLEVQVYFQGAWESGEIKSCSTNMKDENLVFCDEKTTAPLIGKLAADCMIGTHGRPAEEIVAECNQKVADSIRDQSKTFNVLFSEGPWSGDRSKPIEHWGTTGPLWKCTKKEIISCIFVRREGT